MRHTASQNVMFQLFYKKYAEIQRLVILAPTIPHDSEPTLALHVLLFTVYLGRDASPSLNATLQRLTDNPSVSVFRNCTFINNGYLDQPRPRGGAIYDVASSGITLDGCTFTDNYVSDISC